MWHKYKAKRNETHQTEQTLARVRHSEVDYEIHFEYIPYRICCSGSHADNVPTSASDQFLGNHLTVKTNDEQSVWLGLSYGVHSLHSILA